VDKVVNERSWILRAEAVSEPALGGVESELGGVAANLIGGLGTQSFDLGLGVAANVRYFEIGFVAEALVGTLHIGRRLLAHPFDFVRKGSHLAVDFGIPELRFDAQARGILNGFLDIGRTGVEEARREFRKEIAEADQEESKIDDLPAGHGVENDGFLRSFLRKGN